MMNSMVAVSEDLLYPRDSESFEVDLNLMHVRHSVIMCLIVRQVPHDGHIEDHFYSLDDYE